MQPVSKVDAKKIITSTPIAISVSAILPDPDRRSGKDVVLRLRGGYELHPSPFKR